MIKRPCPLPLLFPLLYLCIPPALSAAVVTTNRFQTLDACIEFALQYNRNLKIERLSLTNDMLNVTVSRTKFDPVFSSSTGYNTESETHRSDISVQQTLPGDLELRGTLGYRDASQGETSYAIRLSKVILGGGSLLASRIGIEEALITQLRRLNTLHKMERNLALSISKLYYQLIRASETLKIRESRLQRSLRNLEHAQIRQDPLDIANAEIEVPESRGQVFSARQEIESNLDELKMTMGLALDVMLAVELTLPYSPAQIDLEQGIAFALEHHEDLLNARLELTRLELRKRITETETWPEVSLSASYEGNDVREKDDDTFVGVTLSWPFLERAATAEAKRAQNNVKAQEIQITELTEQKRRRLRALARGLDEQQELIAIQEQRVHVGERRLELYEDRWENGEIDILEYIRSQNELETSRVTLINRQTTYMELLAEYYFEVGRQ